MPQKPESAAACASIATVFTEAGLTNSLITPTSLRNTRLKHLLLNDGLAEAFNQSGLKSIDVLCRNTGVSPRKFWRSTPIGVHAVSRGRRVHLADPLVEGSVD